MALFSLLACFEYRGVQTLWKISLWQLPVGRRHSRTVKSSSVQGRFGFRKLLIVLVPNVSRLKIPGQNFSYELI